MKPKCFILNWFPGETEDYTVEPTFIFPVLVHGALSLSLSLSLSLCVCVCVYVCMHVRSVFLDNPYTQDALEPISQQLLRTFMRGWDSAQ